jgi:RNA polymerase sigma factor (sigma-70 family)
VDGINTAVRAGPPVNDLMTRAGNGDKQAWDTLVERYAPLIWSICRRHQLGADAEDISQSVWTQLLDHLDKIRNPAALPGWLATTTRRECLRLLGTAGGPLADGYVIDAEAVPDEQARTAEEEELQAAERHAALREAFRELPPCGQRLILSLIEDPPCRTPRSAPGWASRSEASGPPAAAAWTCCAAIRQPPP